MNVEIPKNLEIELEEIFYFLFFGFELESPNFDMTCLKISPNSKRTFPFQNTTIHLYIVLKLFYSPIGRLKFWIPDFVNCLTIVLTAIMFCQKTFVEFTFVCRLLIYFYEHFNLIKFKSPKHKIFIHVYKWQTHKLWINGWLFILFCEWFLGLNWFNINILALNFFFLNVRLVQYSLFEYTWF